MWVSLIVDNNDILRRLRYTLDLDDRAMIRTFALADHEVTREQISCWLKKEDDPDFQRCIDVQLATFLSGLINLKRGKREGVQPKPEKHLTNNIILRKLKIALDLKAEDILHILAAMDVVISKHELSAFFRNSSHKHYRECKDQVLRNFLQGLQHRHRKSEPMNPWAAFEPKSGE